MSIVRVGLAETKNFAEGYDAIFGSKDTESAKKPAKKEKAVQAKSATPKKKKATKKK